MIEATGKEYTVEEICKVHKISRQGYYQNMKRETKEHYEEAIVIQLVLEIRHRQPMIGSKKIYYKLNKRFKSMGFKIGRDKLIDIIREHGLLIRRKRKYVRTTNSNHIYKRYKNLIKEIEADKKNRIFVSDITYLETETGFVYLSLITDVYSRKIVGYDVSESLSVEGSIRALEMALKKVSKGEKLIHHSDRGIQYCCNAYTKILIDRGIEISMGEQGNPYENAIAERVNGILKIEFVLDRIYKNKEEAKESVSEAVKIYNTERPHMSLGYKTPDEIYYLEKAA